MSGLFGMLLALGATLAAAPYLLVGAAFIGLIWFLKNNAQHEADRELDGRLEVRDLGRRMWEQHHAEMRGEHVVERMNDHYYVCKQCGAAGSGRWAILHQYPSSDVRFCS